MDKIQKHCKPDKFRVYFWRQALHERYMDEDSDPSLCCTWRDFSKGDKIIDAPVPVCPPCPPELWKTILQINTASNEKKLITVTLYYTVFFLVASVVVTHTCSIQH